MVCETRRRPTRDDRRTGAAGEIDLGLHVERSRRFREHRACVAELTGALQALRTGGSPGPLRSQSCAGLHPVNRGRGAGREPALHPRGPALPHPPQARSRPPVPAAATDESENTNESRNVLFELTMASKTTRRWARAGARGA